MLRKWKKGSHVDPQREKLKEELFTFKKVAYLLFVVVLNFNFCLL